MWEYIGNITPDIWEYIGNITPEIWEYIHIFIILEEGPPLVVSTLSSPFNSYQSKLHSQLYLSDQVKRLLA